MVQPKPFYSQRPLGTYGSNILKGNLLLKNQVWSGLVLCVSELLVSIFTFSILSGCIVSVLVDMRLPLHSLTIHTLYTLAFWPSFKYASSHPHPSVLHQSPETSLWEKFDECLLTRTPSEDPKFTSSLTCRFPWWSGRLPNRRCNYAEHIKAVREGC